MSGVIDNRIVLRFADGEFVVPFWWGSLPEFRQGPEHGEFGPSLPFTLEEGRARVNKQLENNAVGIVMRRYIADHRVRF